MISPKEARSPVGQKLINDLMLEDEGLDAGAVYEDVGDADETPAGKPRVRGSGPLRPSRRPHLQNSGTTAIRPIASAQPGAGRDPQGSSPPGLGPDRPATAPAATHMLLPPQLPLARNPRDPKAAPVSPILERHLVSRHTTAYLGTVTAVLHQVSSPAATGVPRDTQRRPGTIPRDVYHHSAIAPPRRPSPGAEASQARSAGAEDNSVGVGGGNSSADLLRSGASAGGHPGAVYRTTGTLESVRRRSASPAASMGPAPGGADSCLPQMSLIHRGGIGALDAGGSGGGLPGQDGYVPYLDRSYGSHAPLACTVDAVARRAEAHKALTRQRLLQKQQQEQQAGGKGGAMPYSTDSAQQQQQQPHIVLFQPSSAEPYQLRMEGGLHPTTLGLSWDASPGVVAAAAATAAAAAAAIAARAEGLGSSFTSYTSYETPGSSVARSVGFSREVVAFTAGTPLGTSAGVSAATSPSTGGGGVQRRRIAPMWPSTPTGYGVPGLTTPSGASESLYVGSVTARGSGQSPARKMRLPRTPQSAMEAAALALEADAVARAHLPPAVRRGYSGQLAPQTVQDWETITEPNRRMMQAIDNVTNLVRRSPNRGTSRGLQGEPSSGGGRRLPAAGGRASRGPAPSAGAAAGDGDGGEASSSSVTSGPFGMHTSARARRRYIRYSLDILPELGLPTRTGPSGDDNVGTAAAAAAAAAAGAGARASPVSIWGEWSPQTVHSVEYGAMESEGAMAEAAARGGVAGAEDVNMYGEVADAAGGSYTPIHYTAAAAAAAAAARVGSSGSGGGMRYIPAAAARVPVPLHLHPLPTPSAVFAAVVAGGGAAGAAAATLPQWVDTLAAAATASPGLQTSSSELPYSLPEMTSVGSSALPGVLSSSGSLVGTGGGSSSGGGGRRSSSRSPSFTRPTAASIATGLGARGVALQGHSTGPTPAASPTSRSPSPIPSLEFGGETSRAWSTSGDHSLCRREPSVVASAGGGADASRSIASPPLAPFDVSAPASPLVFASFAPSPEVSLMLHGSANPSATGSLGSPDLRHRHSALLQQPQHAQHGHQQPTVDLDLRPHLGLGLAADQSYVLDVDLGMTSSAAAPEASSPRGASAGWGSQPGRSRSPSPTPTSVADSASRLSTPAGGDLHLGVGPGASPLGPGSVSGSRAVSLGARLPSLDSSTHASAPQQQQQQQQRRRQPDAGAGGTNAAEEEGQEEEGPGEGREAGSAESEGGSLLGPQQRPASASASPEAGSGRLAAGRGAAPLPTAVSAPAAMVTLEPGAMAPSPLAATVEDGEEEEQEEEEQQEAPVGLLGEVERAASRSSAGPSASLSRAVFSGSGSGDGTAAGGPPDRSPSASLSSTSAAAAVEGPAGGHVDARGAPGSKTSDLVRQDEAAALAAAAAAEDPIGGDTAAAAAAAAGGLRRPPRVGVLTPQGPVLTPGAGYRVVTSVAAALVSEDPREAARAAAQRELEQQLERGSGLDREMKLKAATRASKALARATPQPTLPPLSKPLAGSAITGYGIVQHRTTHLGEDSGAAGAAAGLDGHSVVVAAPVPAPAEMEAMTTAVRALLAPAPGAVAGRGAPQQHPSLAPLATRRPHDQPHSQSTSPERRPTTPTKPGSYYHVEAALEGGRTAHIQDVWAA